MVGSNFFGIRKGMIKANTSNKGQRLKKTRANPSRGFFFRIWIFKIFFISTAKAGKSFFHVSTAFCLMSEYIFTSLCNRGNSFELGNKEKSHKIFSFLNPSMEEMDFERVESDCSSVG